MSKFLQLLMLGSVIGIGDDGCGGGSSIGNSLGDLTGNLLSGLGSSLSSLADGLGGALGAFNNLGLDLLGLGDTIDANELGLENCRFRMLDDDC
jgi:hypothetical protein